jgi:small subunit ribosomal protein S9
MPDDQPTDAAPTDEPQDSSPPEAEPERPEGAEEARPDAAPPAEQEPSGEAEAPSASVEEAGEADETAAGEAGKAPAAEEEARPEAEAAAAAEEGAGAEEEAPPAAEEAGPRARPVVPGADLEVDIVPEGVDPLSLTGEDPYALEELEPALEEPLDEVVEVKPIERVAIDLAAGARYRATGKRKTAIARVTLRPGTGTYTIDGKALEQHFPRETLQRNIRQPLETVGYEERMDVVARIHGGGISAQAGALRHGISRALLEADPNLRGELKRRGFLTRDARAKERKKAGLKKARKRPQFSKR